MTLGYRGHDNWRDMSEFLVHLTANRDDLKSILSSGRIEPTGPFGATSSITSFAVDQTSACLSEIPLDFLDRLVDRHGRFGFGLTKRFVRSKGGARVWYVDRDEEPANTIFQMVYERAFPVADPADPLWRLTPFVDYVQTGDSPATARHEFEWEREWRVPGGLDFDPSDVKFLFGPQGWHEPMAEWASQTGLDHAVLVDPLWSDGDLQAAWSEVDDDPEA